MRLRNIITKILVFGGICFILFSHKVSSYFFDTNSYADILDLKTLISEGIFPTSDELKEEYKLNGIKRYIYYSSSTDGIITVHAYGAKLEHIIMKFTHDLEEISYEDSKIEFIILSIGFAIFSGFILTFVSEVVRFLVCIIGKIKKMLKKRKEKV